MLTKEEQSILLDIAHASIKHGLEHGTALSVESSDYPASLGEQRATFVTLKIHGELRGCIGTLEAHQPLVQDVAEHAYDAAFRDPRFTPLGKSEYDQLQYHISILSDAEVINFSDEEDLLEKIRPGVDGLILEDAGRRGTFLPSVWENLPTPELFLSNLKQKAGLPANYWSDSIKVSRYTVEEF